MEALFLKVLSMSATAAVVILVVLLFRLLLRKAPKIFSYALWAVVLFRLLCPVRIYSGLSWIPAVQTASAGSGQTMVVVHTQHDALSGPVGMVNDYFTEHPIHTSPEGVYVPELGAFPWDDTVPNWALTAGVVWLAGAVLLLAYGALSLLRLRRNLVGSVPLEGEKNVRLADHIPSPFVLGLFRPKIYLPSDLPEGERDYILLHERTHIRRFDYVFRALAWLALAVHWFNPLVWLAFHLAGKDMEMSCDEAVLRKMGRDVRADYSSSLLRLSTGKRLPAGPLAFGDGDPKSRIKNVLSYKKPALWVVVIALAAVLCAGAALATDPGSFLGPGKPVDFVYHEPGPAELWWDWYDDTRDADAWDNDTLSLVGEIQLPEFPGVTFRGMGDSVWAVTEDEERTLITGTIIKNIYLCDLNGDGCRELCATVSSVTSKGMDDSVCVYDYKHQSLHELGPQGKPFQYILRLEGGRLWAEEWDYKERVERRYGPLALTESGLDIQQQALAAEPGPAELWVDMTGRPYWPESLETQMPEFPGVTFRWKSSDVMAITEDGEQELLHGFPVRSVYLCDLNGDGFRELCATVTKFVTGMYNASILVYDYKYQSLYELEHPMSLPPQYDLQLMGNRLWVEIQDYSSGEVHRAGQLVMTESGLGIRDVSGGGLSAASLTLSLDEREEELGPVVRISGTVGDVALPRGAFWYPEAVWGEHPFGELSMMYPAFTDGIEGHVTAWWTDESRTSVTMSTHMTAMLSSYLPTGYWVFTVDVDSGTVTEMTPVGFTSIVGDESAEVRYYPSSISDEEAVKAASVAAKLLTAAEDYYNNA